MVVDRHVLAFEVAGLAKALAERSHAARVRVSSPGIDECDYRHRCLLRARPYRPRRHSGKSRDEFAPFHGASP
jgi:hypothetical protein